MAVTRLQVHLALNVGRNPGPWEPRPVGWVQPVGSRSSCMVSSVPLLASSLASPLTVLILLVVNIASLPEPQHLADLHSLTSWRCCRENIAPDTQNHQMHICVCVIVIMIPACCDTFHRFRKGQKEMKMFMKYHYMRIPTINILELSFYTASCECTDRLPLHAHIYNNRHTIQWSWGPAYLLLHKLLFNGFSWMSLSVNMDGYVTF